MAPVATGMPFPDKTNIYLNNLSPIHSQQDPARLVVDASPRNFRRTRATKAIPRAIRMFGSLACGILGLLTFSNVDIEARNTTTYILGI